MAYTNTTRTSYNTTQSESAPGGGWSNMSNVEADDNSFSTCVTVQIPTIGNLTTLLFTTGYGFTTTDIPDTAVIDGIQFEVGKYGSNITDFSAKLVVSGAVAGTDLKKTGSWGASETTFTYGGPTELWGRTNTPAEVRATNWGFAIQGQSPIGFGQTAYIDFIRCTVYWHYQDSVLEYPSSGTDLNTVGTLTWATPENIVGAGGGNAVATNIAASNAVTHYLKAVNFGFALSANASIKGIIVQASKGKTSNVMTSSDYDAYLLKAGTITGNDKASATWPGSPMSYGSSTDLWGATWTASDINNTNFGFVLSGQFVGGTPYPSPFQIYVDYIRITVYYDETYATVIKIIGD